MTGKGREVDMLTRERDRESELLPQLLPTRKREFETENHNYYRFYMVHIYEDPTSERQLTLLLSPGLGPAAKWKNPNTGGVKTMFFFL